jgi:hypothetical protein
VWIFMTDDRPTCRGCEMLWAVRSPADRR